LRKSIFFVPEKQAVKTESLKDSSHKTSCHRDYSETSLAGISVWRQSRGNINLLSVAKIIFLSRPVFFIRQMNKSDKLKY
jgi:hypothetical protein